MIRGHFTILALLCTSLALAQSPDQAALPSTVITANSTVVLVPALVTTKRGEPVFTLKAQDFTLTDDGITQSLHLEENNGDEPLALVLAIQTGGAGAHQLGKYSTLPIMVENIVGHIPHQIAVVSFDSVPKLVQDFTSDGDSVESAIHSLNPGDDGAAILDTLGFSVDLLKEQPIKYRRAILLISEKLDVTTNGGRHTQLAEALREISNTNTAIYSLSFPSIRSDAGQRAIKSVQDPTPGPRHGCMANPNAPNVTTDQSSDQATAQSSDDSSASDQSTSDQTPAHTQGRSARQIANQAYDCLGLLAPPLALAKMAFIESMHGLQRNVPETVADLTGGEYFQFKDTHSLERALQTISNHVPNRYMLSFQPQSPHPGLHAVKLHLKDYPELELSARNSYWVESDSSAAK